MHKVSMRVHGYKHPPRKIEKDLTQGPLLKQIILYSIPLLLTNVLLHVFKTADIAVLAIFVGDRAVAAVGSTTSLISLMTMLFIGISVGVNVMVSRYIGEHDEEAVKKTIGLSVPLALLFGVVLIFVGQFCSRFFLEIMDCDENVIDLAEKYLRFYFYGVPLVVLYNFMSAIMRASGDTVRPLIYLIIGGVLNVGLNLFFVLVLGRDVEGVAIATVVSQGVSALLCIISLIKAKGVVKLRAKYMRFYKRELLAVLKIGVPSGLQSSLFAISNVTLQSAINSFGEFAMAGSSYAAEVDVYIYACMNSIAVAIMSFISQNYGAENYDRVKKSVIYALIINTVLGLAIGLLVVLLGTPVIKLVTSEEKVVEYFTIRNIIMSSTYFLCGLMEVLSYSVRGLGKSVVSMIVSLIGACLFRIVWVEVVVKLTGDFSLIWWSYTASWAITSLIFVPILLSQLKKTKRKFSKKIENSVSA
ncbi:MAG: MATE family efflux transporter [Clostridia bacterium]|nr:MATE family efflux transporter [Clostridia bacterium]